MHHKIKMLPYLQFYSVYLHLTHTLQCLTKAQTRIWIRYWEGETRVAQLVLYSQGPYLGVGLPGIKFPLLYVVIIANCFERQPQIVAAFLKHSTFKKTNSTWSAWELYTVFSNLQWATYWEKRLLILYSLIAIKMKGLNTSEGGL